MFPIEDGRRVGYNVLADDAAELKRDVEWRGNYREGVRLVAAAWGWDALEGEPLEHCHSDQKWSFWDVRLAKMIRSLWLFEEDDLFRSMQKLARVLKPNGGFRYGTICLDEILYMQATTVDLEIRPRTRSTASSVDDQP